MNVRVFRVLVAYGLHDVKKLLKTNKKKFGKVKMAGMSAFGRRWSVATDDFLFVGIIDFFIFLFWLCWTSIAYEQSKATTCNCQSNAQCVILEIFLVGAIILFALNWVISFLLVFYGSRGSISEPEKRKAVVPLVYLKCAICCGDVCWAAIGSSMFPTRYNCISSPVLLNVQIITGFFWVALVARVLGLWLMFDSKGKEKKNSLTRLIENEHMPIPVAERTAKKWKKRMWTMFFGFASRDRKVAIGAASELLAFLTDDLDIVLTDFVCGINLYRAYSFELHDAEKRALDAAPSILMEDGTEADSFPTLDMPPWMNLKLACHFFKVGMGVFGWPWVLYRNLTCGLCHLCKNMVCCLPCRHRFANIEGDNVCGCNLAGLRYTSGYSYEDLVHVRFVDKVYQIPFFVAVDDETESVVLVVRGSMSMADALTDISAQFSPVDEPGLPKDGVCHGGALIAARRIRERLEQNGVLAKAFAGREGHCLVITGHSIGAGVSTLLTLLLRNSYSNIRCYAFAPPPVMNAVLLPLTTDRVFTAIYGNDAVPCLNYKNVRNFLVDMCKMLDECQEPKHKVLFSCCGMCKPKRVRSKSRRGASSTGDAESNGAVNGTEPVANGPLPESVFLLPGRILHIRESSNGYRLHMRSAEDFSRLLFRPNVVSHHFPQYIEGALKNLGINEKITKDDDVLKSNLRDK